MAEVILPSTQHRMRIAAEDLSDLKQRRWSLPEVTFRAAATRALALAAEVDVLVAGRGRVTLLPHQLATLERAMSMNPVRLAICDEVGLGKTITAGAIFAEMKARGRIRRVVVVAPKGVQLQWVAEMSERFGEEFVRVGPEGLPIDIGVDPWRMFDQIVCSLDTVEPLRRRAGWSPEQVDAHNAERFRALVEAGWDMVIFDEAHDVAGSSKDVARHRLAVELATNSANVLLLSATPHSGKSESFRRFLGLLDEEFLRNRPVDRPSVAPLVARAEKRLAVDEEGRPLFRPRSTSIRVVPYVDRYLERELYGAVTEYVRNGWRTAKRDGHTGATFLILLMQRLVSSSTAAILAALEKRSAAIGEPGERPALFIDRGDEWAELTGEEQFEALVVDRDPAWETERRDLARLLDLARSAAVAGVDAKVRSLFEVLGELRRPEGDPHVKVLVFTEFVATQEMLLRVLEEAGVSALAISGSMGLAERALAHQAFRDRAQVLVSTDAGGEGVNLQFAHIVVNWDLPWSPSRLEQRIGRVDRIGQRRPVRAYNLVCEHSVEARVLEVLEAKLGVILEELGADKRGDVLESASRHSDELWTAAIVTPDQFNEKADEFASGTLAVASESGHFDDLVVPTGPAKRAVSSDRLTALVRAAADARAELGRPVTDPLDALTCLPEVVPGEPCPVVRIADMPGGWCSVWEVTPDGACRSSTAVFQPDVGPVRPDVATAVWNLCSQGVQIVDEITPTAVEWHRLCEEGVDHAYRAVAQIAGHAGLTLPDARLRLLVRIAQ